MKISKFFLFAAVALMGVACEPSNTPVDPSTPGGNENGDGGNEGDEPTTEYTVLELKASSEYLVADGEDQITFTVLGDGKDITSQATIYDNKTMKEVKDGIFSTTTPGTYTFWAAVGTQYTEKIKITALEHAVPQIPADPQPENFNFAQRTLLTYFTGTGCPNCPTMSSIIKTVANDPNYSDKFLMGAHHSYTADDPMYISKTLAYAFGINGYPTAVVGFEWTVGNYKDPNLTLQYLKASIDACLTVPVKVGLAANSLLNGNTLTVNAELKAVETGEYTIGCWVLEDGISAYQAGAGMMTHDNAIRADVNPVIGNSLGSVEAGKTASTFFNFNLKNEWVKDNCHIIVFACYYFQSEEGSGYYITNAISTKLNEAKAYEYK